jgi:hypothetical protein
VDAELTSTIQEDAVWQSNFQHGSPKHQELGRARGGKFPTISLFSLVLVSCFISLLAVAQQQNDRRILRAIHEVTQLTNIEARNAYPVQLEAVVTYSDPEWGLLFIEDATGAIYVNTHGMSSSFAVGSRVKVEAVTGPGDVGTILVTPHVQIIGAGTLPTPERRTLGELNAQKADSRFVSTQGVLRAGDQPWKRVCFRVYEGDMSALVVVPQAMSQDARRLVGATVRLRGVSGVHIDAKGKITGALIFVNRLEDIEVVGGAARDPNALAVIVNKNNPVNDLSSSDLRRILLGEREYWKGSRKITLLLPTLGTQERVSTLRLVDMDEADYKKHWVEKSSASGTSVVPAAPASGFAVNLVAETEDAIAVVPMADVKGSVKVLRIDGYLPSDAAYPIH